MDVCVIDLLYEMRHLMKLALHLVLPLNRPYYCNRPNFQRICYFAILALVLQYLTAVRKS